MSKREFTPEEIAKSLRLCTGLDPLNRRAADMIEAQAKRIKQLAGQLILKNDELLKLREENRWIPITERLPATDDGPKLIMEDFTAVWVLVMIEGAATATTLYFDVDSHDFFDMQGDELIPYRVSHWKPMPKGPEVGHD